MDKLEQFLDDALKEAAERLQIAKNRVEVGDLNDACSELSNSSNAIDDALRAAERLLEVRE